MNVIAKIAFRNISRHKTKTLIVGILIAIGMTVLVVGNSLMETAERGIAKSYIDSYTGHLLITGRSRATMTLTGMQGLDAMDAVMPTIPAFSEVLRYAENHPAVEAVNPQAYTLLLVDYADRRSVTQAFGIDPVYYERMFPGNIEIVSGRMLQPGEDGIVLNEEIVEHLQRRGDIVVEPGETVLLTGATPTGGIRIREVPIRGIYRFRQDNPALDLVSLMDITNVRALAGMNLLAVSEAELTELEATLLGGVDEDALFGAGSDSLFSDLFSDALVDDVSLFDEPLDESVLLADLTAEEEDAEWTTDGSDAWHFLLLRIKDGVQPAIVALEMQRYFDEQGIEVQVSDWLTGAGAVALLATGTKLVFNVVVLVIAVVAIIIIMNTLVISVAERTTEIGTMRALGAQKSFVRRMIVGETLFTSGIFGVVGVVFGLLVLLLLNLTGIEAPNPFFEMLFGGKVLHPTPSVSAIIMSMIVVLIIGVVASGYPVSIALRTEPVKAMQE